MKFISSSIMVAAGLALTAGAQGALDGRFVADFAPNMFGSSQYTAWELSMIQVSQGTSAAAVVATSPTDFNNVNGTFGNDVAMTIATDTNTGHADQFSDRGGRTFLGTVLTDDAGGKVVISQNKSRPIVEMTYANENGQLTSTYKFASLIAFNRDSNGGWYELYRGSAQNASFSADLVIAYAMDDTVTPAPVAGISTANQFSSALAGRENLDHVGGRIFLRSADLSAGNAFGGGWNVGFNAVPTPGAISALGLAGLAFTRRRR